MTILQPVPRAKQSSSRNWGTWTGSPVIHGRVFMVPSRVYIIQIIDNFAPPLLFFENHIFPLEYSKNFLFAPFFPTLTPYMRVFLYKSSYFFPNLPKTLLLPPQNEKYTPLQNTGSPVEYGHAFLVPCKKWLVYRSVHWTSHFLQGTWKTWCIDIYIVYLKSQLLHEKHFFGNSNCFSFLNFDGVFFFFLLACV